ncbi:MAG: hypothetical protein E4H07_10030 [Nitrosomonadales bacterium]|nr:MAG: hypothetical protein E4H07_10030 [Nitrosomonadales bacterium]
MISESACLYSLDEASSSAIDDAWRAALSTFVMSDLVGELLCKENREQSGSIRRTCAAGHQGKSSRPFLEHTTKKLNEYTTTKHLIPQQWTS